MYPYDLPIFYFPIPFFRATEEYNTYEKHVSAPYIRKEFDLTDVANAKIYISGLGFYDLWINGRKITKGLCAPYISNPDDMVYFDCYDITPYLVSGANAVGIMLGNGMQNCPGGRVWDFDIAHFRGAPRFAFIMHVTDRNGEEKDYLADESFKCHPSDIIFDDLRSGAFCDSRLHIEGWNMPGFDDSGWTPAIPAERPAGEFRICEADPIVVTKELAPVKIYEAPLCRTFDNRENMRLDTQLKFSYRGKVGTVYDFGVNTAGICRLKITGKPGQEIYIQFCEFENSEGEPSFQNTGSFYPEGYGQTLYFVCDGSENQIFEPPFTYFGYRYAVVYGLEKEQILPETLTMLVANSDLRERAGFTCSDEIMNKLGAMSRVSDLANFWYFPTDCPHREKNGWTGDASVSCERLLLTLTPEKSYREWLRNICKAQDIKGSLPGIVPTGGWGFEWGNGPAWDNVLTELCWQIARMTGDLEPARECSQSMLRYLSYLSGVRRADGLIAIGLGDWLQPGKGAGDPTTPLYITDSVISMYIASKSADLFRALNMPLQEKFAAELRDSLRSAIRKNCIDFGDMCCISRTQTGQAICIYYGVFDAGEKAEACRRLVELVHEKNDHFDCGMIGVRTIFHVLSDCGEGSLAYKMITRTDFPSYGMFVRRGLTALPEDFLPDDETDRPNSMNHHFMGDIVSWFIQRVVGIRVNPDFGSDEIIVMPDFVDGLDSASAWYDNVRGTENHRITVSWKRDGNTAEVIIDCDENIKGIIRTPKGWLNSDEDTRCFRHNATVLDLEPGTYKFIKA